MQHMLEIDFSLMVFNPTFVCDWMDWDLLTKLDPKKASYEGLEPRFLRERVSTKFEIRDWFTKFDIRRGLYIRCSWCG